jgi:hypothetical protein
VPRVDGREKSEEKMGQTRMVAETEALGAERLRVIVRAELEALLPEPLVHVQRVGNAPSALPCGGSSRAGRNEA